MSATVPVGVRATVPAEAGAALATVPADVGVIARRDADTVRTAVLVGAGVVAPVRPRVRVGKGRHCRRRGDARGIASQCAIGRTHTRCETLCAAGEGARAWTRAARTAWSALNEFCFCFVLCVARWLQGVSFQTLRRQDSANS